MLNKCLCPPVETSYTGDLNECRPDYSFVGIVIKNECFYDLVCLLKFRLTAFGIKLTINSNRKIALPLIFV